jgi:hypothetical protein
MAFPPACGKLLTPTQCHKSRSFGGCDLLARFFTAMQTSFVHGAVTLAPEYTCTSCGLSTATCDHLHHWSRKGESFTLPSLLFFYVYLTVDHFVET